MKAVHFVVDFYKLVARWAGPTVLSLLLLLMRIIWGYAFFVTGKGKLSDINKPIGFFTDLHIPFPVANAWFVSSLECFGGLLLIAGLGSRAVAFLLTINMIVAYATTEHEALSKLFNDGEPGKFIAADPFWYLLTAVVILALGPGWFSVDALLKRFVFSRGCCSGKCEVVTPALSRDTSPVIS